MKTINSWDELLDAGIQEITGKISKEEIVLGEDLTIQIRVKGESWDGYLDYRGAQFVIDLQNAVIKTYKEFVDTKITLQDLKKSVTVKVKVEEGSALFNIQMDDVLKKIMEKVTGKQIAFVATVAILSTAGYFTTSKVLDYRAKTIQTAKEQQLSQTYVTRISDTMDKALDIIQRRDLEAPTRKLVSKLDDKDEIQLPGAELMKAGNAKNLYPRKQRINKESGLFDYKYTIAAINMEKTPIEFRLKKDDLDFWASAELSPTDIKNISQSLEAAMKNKEELVMDLQLFVVYDKRKIHNASIQGTGTPRKDSQKPIALTAYWQKNK